MSRASRLRAATNGIALTALAVVSLLAATYLVVGVLQIDPVRSTTTVSVDLSESGGLQRGAEVVYRGVDVGRVDSVQSVPGGARVTMSYQSRYRIPVGSSMKVHGLSALGEPVFEFRPESTTGPFIGDGAHLLGKDVSIPATIPELLTSTSKLFDQIDPAKVRKITDTLVTAMTGLEKVTPSIYRGSTLLAASLISAQPALARGLRNTMTMMRDADWLAPSMSGLPAALVDMSQVANLALTWLFRMSAVTNGSELFDSMVAEEQFVVGITKKIVPNMVRQAVAMRPVTQSTGELLKLIDFGSVLDQALHALPGDRLRIAVEIPH